MERAPHSFEQPVDSNSAITEIIVVALFCVYDSEADLEACDIADSVWTKTGYSAEDCARLVSLMFEDGPNKYLQNSSIDGQRTAFTADGLWLLENCFLHGEENVDSMALAERVLSKTRYVSQD